MSRYYTLLSDKSKVSRSLGARTEVPPGFHTLSSLLISQCSYAQSLIQHVIYASHGAEVLDARHALRDFPSPKSRIDFLCSFPYSEVDPVITKVFDYSRQLFRELYELRDLFAHELWSSSEEHANSVLFSSLDEEARLLTVSGRIWHKQDATPQEVYNGTIRFIRNIKVVSSDNLRVAVSDVNLCAWMLMNIGNVLTEQDPGRKEEARQGFLVFKGTSHLFGNAELSSAEVEFHSSRNKTIAGLP